MSQSAEVVMALLSVRERAKPNVMCAEGGKCTPVGGWLNSSSIIHLEMSSRIKAEKSENVKKRG